MDLVYAVLFTSVPNDKKIQEHTSNASILAQNPAILESVLSYLDFHDVTQLLKTGASAIRQQLLDLTHEVRIGRLGPYTSSQETIIPPNILSTLSAFRSLETISLISPSVAIPVGKTSPFLELGPTLQHLTISTQVSDVKQIPRLVEIPWSVKFPLLQTLRLSIAVTYDATMLVIPYVKLRIEKMSLPSTLLVFSLLLPNLKNQMDVINDICHPIGYKLKAHKKIVAQNNLTWTSLYNSHSDADRRNFAWLLPNLRFLEMTPYMDPASNIWLDFSILPPLLETLRMSDRFMDVHAYRLSIDSLELFQMENSGSASTLPPPSSLRSLAMTQAPNKMIQVFPPSLTRATAIGHPNANMDQLLPHRVHSTCRVPDVAIGPHVRSLFCFQPGQFPGKFPGHLKELSVYVRPSNLSFWDLPAMLPEDSKIQSLKFCTDTQPGPTMNEEQLTQFHSRLSSLTSIHLGFFHPINPDLMSYMPRTLTKMAMIRLQVINDEFKLRDSPPLLTSLHLPPAPSTYVRPEELQCLPRGMRHLLLPPISVETNPMQDPAVNPAVEILFDTKLLPPDCECYLAFAQQGTLLPLSWRNLPALFRERITLTPIAPRQLQLYISAEDEIDM